jgi:TRAP transporter TAXI family solute receptor
MLTRRAVCRAALAAAAAALTGCGTERYCGPDREITIAGGQDGGFYWEFAQLLAREVNAAEPRLHCSAEKTFGSVENIELIGAGDAHIGVCQSDVALAAVHGTEPFTRALPLAGIGRMYEDYLQLVVLADSDLHTVEDLAGRTVSLGALRSGTELTGKRLMAAAQVRAYSAFQPLDVAATALADGRVDALLWCGGVPTPVLTALHARKRIRLLPLAEKLDALRARYRTAYQQVVIPAGGYAEAGTRTIGVANLLLCAGSLPDDVVAAVTAVLVDAASRLVPPQALGTQFLDRRALINLLDVPMHPGAGSAYRQLHG